MGLEVAWVHLGRESGRPGTRSVVRSGGIHMDGHEQGPPCLGLSKTRLTLGHRVCSFGSGLDDQRSAWYQPHVGGQVGTP